MRCRVNKWMALWHASGAGFCPVLPLANETLALALALVLFFSFFFSSPSSPPPSSARTAAGFAMIQYRLTALAEKRANATPVMSVQESGTVDSSLVVGAAELAVKRHNVEAQRSNRKGRERMGVKRVLMRRREMR